MKADRTEGARMKMCSRLARERGEDIVGHAFEYDRIIITEMSKPWPCDTGGARGYARVLHELADRFYDLKMKVYEEQGQEGVVALGLDAVLNHVAPDAEYSPPGYARIWHLKRPEGPFSAYHKDEYLLPQDDVAGLLEALLFKKTIPEWEGALTNGAERVRDLLVCTHGSVDTCCATFGYPTYRKLRSLANRSGGKLRVWQATHFQYHRFAPVILDLPEVRYWGMIGPEHAEALAWRDIHPKALCDCYVGWAGVEREFAQAAEREVFMREGWKWISYYKSARVTRLDEAGKRAQVRIAFTSPDEDFAGGYLALVEVSGHVPGLVGCLYPGQTVEAPQYRVLSLDPIS
jgi:hypothetical protein